jgi:hypothetical protein
LRRWQHDDGFRSIPFGTIVADREWIRNARVEVGCHGRRCERANTQKSAKARSNKRHASP